MASSILIILEHHNCGPFRNQSSSSSSSSSSKNPVRCTWFLPVRKKVTSSSAEKPKSIAHCSHLPGARWHSTNLVTLAPTCTDSTLGSALGLPSGTSAACFSTMVNCDALVRSGVPLLPGLTTVPQKDEPDMMDAGR